MEIAIGLIVASLVIAIVGAAHLIFERQGKEARRQLKQELWREVKDYTERV